MPLSVCPDCGREVSTRARHCVHCGRPWPAATCCGSAFGVLLGLIVALGVIGGVCFMAKSRCCAAKAESIRARAVERIAPAEAPKVEAPKAATPAPPKVEEPKKEE